VDQSKVLAETVRGGIERVQSNKVEPLKGPVYSIQKWWDASHLLKNTNIQHVKAILVCTGIKIKGHICEHTALSIF